MGYIPKTMAVVGGGVIACEYASVFAALGIQVTQIDRNERILPFVDREIARRLVNHLDRLGLRLLVNEQILKVDKKDKCVRLSLSSGESLTVDCVLYAAGRQSNIAGLGLEALSS